MRRATAILMLLALIGCPVSSEVVRQWKSRSLYTCCNIHFEPGEKVSDANYLVGSMLPFGSPASVQDVTSKTLTFRSGGGALTLVHDYGRDQETSQQYFAKMLIETDPHARFATFPPMVQAAIQDGRVERGMTKEQVIMSLGYPPTHRTASTDLATWTYWSNHWVTFKVQFDNQGVVNYIVGNNPSRGEPIVAPSPIPR